MNKARKKFFDKFLFSPEKTGFLGAEVELYLAKEEGFQPVPEAWNFLQDMNGVWGPELAACQVEYHTSPVRTPKELGFEIEKGLWEGREGARKIGLNLVAEEVAPLNIPLDVYPSDRYLEIAKSLPKAVLRAACRVAGIHIHVGAGEWKEALMVYNRLASEVDRFVAMGDHSEGKRIQLYQVMAPDLEPPLYGSREDLFQKALEEGFVNDPRSCYHLVRLNPKGTVEVRAFGTTDRPEEVVFWAEEIRRVVKR